MNNKTCSTDPLPAGKRDPDLINSERWAMDGAITELAYTFMLIAFVIGFVLGMLTRSYWIAIVLPAITPVIVQVMRYAMAFRIWRGASFRMSVSHCNRFGLPLDTRVIDAK